MSCASCPAIDQAFADQKEGRKSLKNSFWSSQKAGSVRINPETINPFQTDVSKKLILISTTTKSPRSKNTIATKPPKRSNKAA